MPSAGISRDDGPEKKQAGGLTIPVTVEIDSLERLFWKNFVAKI